MNILYYIPKLGQEGGGTKQYAIALLNILVKDTVNVYYVLNVNKDPDVKKIIEHKSNFKLLCRGESYIEKQIFNFFKAFFYLKSNGKRSFLVSFLDLICWRYKIDIVHSPLQGQPFCRNVKNIFTFHDMQELHFPEYFNSVERASRARSNYFNTTYADKIIVSYEHIKKDVIRYFGVAEERVHVVLLNMSKLWFYQYTEKDLSHVTLNLDYEKFILYPANTWKHKNHDLLIQSISKLNDDGLAVNLVCVGHQNEHFKEIERRVKSLKIEKQVTFLGVVSEEVLYKLYQTCLGVVVPTTYEAGSFPLMESILMKIPVVCSNVTSLPETIGDNRFTFDPFSISEISEKIKRLWTDKEYRKESITNSTEMQERLIIDESFLQIQNIYKQLN